MRLFDVGLPRHGTQASGYAEPHFSYLNSTGRCDAFRVRDLLEGWFAEFPDDGKPDLSRRFRSSSELAHYGAFFELYVHALFRRLGCKVDVIVPNQEKRGRSPDFRVRGPDGSEFLLEATVATDKSREAAAAEKIINQVYDTLNRVESPNFFIGVEVYGRIRRAPSHRVLRPAVEAFLQPLDPDSVAAMLGDGGLQDLPRVRIPLDGGWLEVFAIPKSQSARGRGGLRPLGMTGPGEAQWVDRSVALRKAVASKATRYGELDVPYVVAVNAITQHLDQIDVMEALFGKETYAIPIINGRSGEPQLRREGNGAWVGPHGPVNTRVSAVLVASAIVPWSVGAYTPIIYYNPFAARPLAQAAVPGLPRAVSEGDKMIERSGILAPEIFDLVPGWPRVDDEAA